MLINHFLIFINEADTSDFSVDTVLVEAVLALKLNRVVAGYPVACFIGSRAEEGRDSRGLAPNAIDASGKKSLKIF